MNAKAKKILAAYKKLGGRIETRGKVQLPKMSDFSLWYTPGVGTVSSHLAKHPKDARAFSIKKNSVAVVSDGSAVLGLGNIGPYGALPVMEGKSLIFKNLAGIDAWPIVLDAHEPEEIIKIVKAIAPAFGGINLEDIAGPQCFDIERRLIEELDIPVMHDDQHGTAIVVLAAVINATKVVKKDVKKLKVAILGAGAAGSGTARLLRAYGIRDIVLADSKGIISKHRTDLSGEKLALSKITNPRNVSGESSLMIKNADVLIGLSGGGAITPEEIKSMAPRSIVFAMANPIPEIMPDIAKKAGAMVIGTGRSDFPNQVNNSLVFPGVFRGALDRGVRKITEKMKLSAATALASLIKRPTASNILPTVLDKRVVPTIAKAIR
ncbi:malate dehydrogenase [Candidatus Kaiserbacteria bacterium RIFCSPHIGHO2_01_FULL_48_10]|uniref:Malate dehydrogenase n=1 Tax=Candidatus Kaiserbacteria bacterium RIFCSPHIGHO2_01_FULL_48_10 TaxID=1798476 RepID=A0A1F6C5Y3_9BACT|nr:MAG: malate dehydrogenase [Candidatus Kaiserbacteria bacterium RIFCSPHIGHO2_01_FULL_48_10]